MNAIYVRCAEWLKAADCEGVSQLNREAGCSLQYAGLSPVALSKIRDIRNIEGSNPSLTKFDFW